MCLKSLYAQFAHWFFCVCTAEPLWQTHWELLGYKTENEGFGVAKSMSGLKLRRRCYGLTLNRSSMFKHFQHNRIKNILHVRVSQNFSTTVWNSLSQLFQILDCGFCCQGAHKKLLGLGDNYFFRQVWMAFLN